MMKFQYTTEEERNAIIADMEAQGKFLIEEQELITGNFLIFGDKPKPLPREIENELRLLDLEDALLTLMFGGVA